MALLYLLSIFIISLVSEYGNVSFEFCIKNSILIAFENRSQILIYFQIGSAHSHGRLVQPPSRASAWRYGFNTPADYNDNEGFCGGFDYQFNVADGNCGICGDPWFADPREHEAPNGKYATGTITAAYDQGQTIDVQIDITANHRGLFEFRLCPNKSIDTDPEQGCFDK